MLVYQHFCQTFKKNPNRFKLSDARVRKIKSRLKDAGKDQIVEAINRCYQDDFYSGRSKKWHGADLDWIIDKYENVEKLANLVPNGRQPAPQPKPFKAPERRELSPAQQKKASEKIAEIRAKLAERKSLRAAHGGAR